MALSFNPGLRKQTGRLCGGPVRASYGFIVRPFLTHTHSFSMVDYFSVTVTRKEHA